MPIKINDREYRNMRVAVRAMQNEEGEERQLVTGYASTFNEPYLLWKGRGWKFYEVVDPGAFDETDMSDVIMQYDHEGRVFARTRNKTLSVGVDDKGLYIEADLGGTEIGRQLYEEIAGGYTDRMSFGFNVTDEYEEYEEGPEGVSIYTRHIKKVGKLYDVSAVSLPANDGTSIEADATTRSIDKIADGVIERIQAERLDAKRLETARRFTNLRITKG